MDFFKSVFSPDPESGPSDTHDHEDDNAQQELQREEGEEEEEEEEENSPNPNPSEESGLWSFGGMIKTLATRSESVIQTYRRDLEEFGLGLKKETEAIKEAASRVVGDLPGSLEAGASVAQESLESVGQAIDEFGGSVWRGTAEIISQSRDLLDPDASSHDSYLAAEPARRYTRFEAQVIAIQNDPNTFMQSPEDGEDFGRWKLGFRLEEKEEEIEGLLYENRVLEGFFEKFVPDVVDLEAFWRRYFYRVHKLLQAEEARAKLVQRVIASEEEEELSWEVDDDGDDQEELENKEIKEEVENKEEKDGGEEKSTEKEVVETSESVEEKEPIEEQRKEEEIAETTEKPAEEQTKTEIVETSETREQKEPTGASKVESLDNKAPSEAKVEPMELSKDSDFSAISSQPSVLEEDDLGWDEIEDLGEHNYKKVGGSGGSPRKEDLRKRLTVAEDDKDLSWDIEDDEDEPLKK